MLPVTNKSINSSLYKAAASAANNSWATHTHMHTAHVQTVLVLHGMLLSHIKH